VPSREYWYFYPSTRLRDREDTQILKHLRHMQPLCYGQDMVNTSCLGLLDPKVGCTGLEACREHQPSGRVDPPDGQCLSSLQKSVPSTRLPPQLVFNLSSASTLAMARSSSGLTSSGSAPTVPMMPPLRYVFNAFRQRSLMSPCV